MVSLIRVSFTYDFICCFLILLFATMGITGPVRAQSEDALESIGANEKAIPTNITGYKNPPGKSVTKDSEDTSEEWSAESFAMNGHTVYADAVKDLGSDEVMSPLVLKKDKGQKGADIKSVGPMDTSRKLVQDPWSIEQIGPQGPHRASREWIDFHSEEEMIVVAHEVSQLPGQKIINLHADKVTGGTSQRANIQRKAGRVDVLNGMVAQDESRELDRDSLEDRQNNGRPYPVGNSRDRDWDETQECISSETHSQAPPQQTPFSSFVPAKSQAS